MADLVERGGQVSIQNPYPRGLSLKGGEQGFYRVVAAAARPEPIGPGLKPRLPLGLQCAFHPCLMAAVDQQRYPEGPHFGLVTGFRYVHPPDRGWPVRADAGVHAHRHLGPGLAGQRDQPVDPRRPAARVALRHLPHADQRVTPAPQHELLQAPGTWPVAVPHRLEDPAAQPPYLLLMVTPVRTFPGVTIEEGQALRSAHRGVQHALWCWHSRCFLFQGSPAHVSALSSPGSTARHPGQLCGGHPGEVPALRPLLSCCLSAARHPLPGHPNPARDFRPPYGRPTAPPAHTRA